MFKITSATASTNNKLHFLSFPMPTVKTVFYRTESISSNDPKILQLDPSEMKEKESPMAFKIAKNPGN